MNGGLARVLEEIAAAQNGSNLQSRSQLTHEETVESAKKPHRYFQRRPASKKILQVRILLSISLFALKTLSWQSEVRSAVKDLLGELPWETPSNAELAAFEERPTSNNGPVLSPFRLDLRQGKYSTPWNKQAAKLFAESFASEEEAVCTDRAQIKDAFLAHLKTLQKHYQQFCEDIQAGGVIDGAAEVKKRDIKFHDAAGQRQYNVWGFYSKSSYALL
jgi:hypothetical protein